MLRVFQEKDRVILDLCGRGRDRLLTCSEAENLEYALEAAANGAELSLEKTPLRGEVWDIRIESYDGRVALRIVPPLVGRVDHVALPYQVARKLADLIRFKRQQAAYKMRFVRDPSLC